MEVKEAGRWKTIKMPAQHYGHLEQSKVDEDARKVGEEWAAKMLHNAEIVAPAFRANAGQGKR